MIELYKSGDKRKAITLMMKDLEERLHEVTMTAPSYDELQAVYMARNLYLPNDIGDFPPDEENIIY